MASPTGRSDRRRFRARDSRPARNAMISRRIALIVVLLGGLSYLSTHTTLHDTSFGNGSPLTLAHAAPEYTSEEVNNISLYKRVVPAVVSTTSTTVTLAFFYGYVPSKG